MQALPLVGDEAQLRAELAGVGRHQHRDAVTEDRLAEEHGFAAKRLVELAELSDTDIDFFLDLIVKALAP